MELMGNSPEDCKATLGASWRGKAPRGIVSRIPLASAVLPSVCGCPTLAVFGMVCLLYEGIPLHLI